MNPASKPVIEIVKILEVMNPVLWGKNYQWMMTLLLISPEDK
jgi:hypothetical protein